MRNSHPQSTRRFIPAHKENKDEAGRTKKLAEAQETKEAPFYEEVHSGEEIKGGGSVKIDDWGRHICWLYLTMFIALLSLIARARLGETQALKRFKPSAR